MNALNYFTKIIFTGLVLTSLNVTLAMDFKEPCKKKQRTNSTSISYRSLSQEQKAYYLDQAIQNADKTTVSRLLAAGANPNGRISDEFSLTPMYHTTMYHTPMYTLAMFYNQNIATQLIDAHGDVNVVNQEGRTPLYKACEFGLVDAAKFFIEHNANLNLQDSNGNTALHAVCQNYSFYNDAKQALSTIAMLVATGANTTIINHAGKTAIKCATEEQRSNIIAAIKHGQARARGWIGVTTLIASYRANQEHPLRHFILPTRYNNQPSNGLIPMICTLAGFGSQHQVDTLNRLQDQAQLQWQTQYAPLTNNSSSSSSSSSNSTSSMTVSSMSALSSSSSSSSSSSNVSKTNGLDSTD